MPNSKLVLGLITLVAVNAFALAYMQTEIQTQPHVRTLADLGCFIPISRPPMSADHYWIIAALLPDGSVTLIFCPK